MFAPISIPSHRRTTSSSRVNVLVFTALALLSAGVFFAFTLPNLKKRAPDGEPTPVETANMPDPAKETQTPTDKPKGTAQTPVRKIEPSRQMEAIAKGLLDGKPEVFLDVLGPELVTPRVMDKLATLFAAGGYELDPAKAVSELARQADIQRWSLNLRRRGQPDDKAAIELDFVRKPDGTWQPGAIRLPGDASSSAGEIIADANAMDVALGFVNATLAQNFGAARKLVDPAKVSDASIAGLCILFEEGAFALRKEKPLVATVAREDVAWFLAHVESTGETKESSRFGMVLQRDAGKPWQISEINLDRLLAAYANRFGEGDIHYTPLVRNPQGGDSIVLYFAYDSGELHERTLRQIRIVANVLKADAGRKLKISGHTDSRGQEDYNNQLSRVRAEAVRKAMVESGLPENQVSVEGFGASMPRQENIKPDGSDNPDGRKVNRRAEIFLDF